METSQALQVLAVSSTSVAETLVGIFPGRCFRHRRVNRYQAECDLGARDGGLLQLARTIFEEAVKHGAALSLTFFDKVTIEYHPPSRDDHPGCAMIKRRSTDPGSGMRPGQIAVNLGIKTVAKPCPKVLP